MVKRKDWRLLSKVLFLAGVFLIFQHPTFAVSNEELNKIFAAAIAAAGGEKEIGRIRSIEAFAYCVGPKGKYTTDIVSFRTGKTRFVQHYSYREQSTDIFINGKFAWETADKTVEFALVSPFQKLAVQLHEYQKMAIDFQKMFHDFAVEGTESFENRPSIKVRAKNELNTPIYLFFDAETRRLSGYLLPIPDSNESVKNVFNEWRTVGKLKLPSKVTATDSSGDWVLDFQKISINKAAAESFNVPPRVSDLTELLRLQEQAKTAHLTYNAELMVEPFAENLTQLQRGSVSTRTKAENLARFKSYFGSFKFTEWENIKPPVIKISKDGTLATIIVQKRVRGTSKNDKGEEIPGQTDFAWLEVWEKINGKWKLATVASTEKVVENNK